ncbi:SDR family oxidoreductase [Phanerochaete sordida]|uniref:SDR family oxidoreductase n=1 Tax=Phanerochaete sordida TaxID=48140 RepID=A0A9P3LEJ0_9APHY|nr:SDR family oxidoreductase [Phanerochaete sordida]
MNTSKVWLVTGAASGFGLAVCKRALAEGDKVVATLRKPSDLDAFAKDYSQDRLLVLKVDVTSEDDVTSAFREAKARFGRVDVVLNNAAAAMLGEVEGVPVAAARSAMDVNFWGAVTVSKEAVRFFRDENPAAAGGLLLTMSSDSGHAFFPCLGYYNAAKHALEGLTEAFANELDPKWNIKICLVTPGAFRTELNAKGSQIPIHPAYADVEAVTQSRQIIGAVYDKSRIVRIGDPAKAAEAIHELSTLEKPPMRAFLGGDCIKRVREKHERVSVDLDASEKWSEKLLEDE